MKKLVLKIVSFMILFSSILFIYVDKKFSKDNIFKTTIDEFERINKDSLDIIFMGSSHAFSTYNPGIVDEHLKTFSFNLGSGGQKLIVTHYLFEEYLNGIKPRLVILDVFPGSVGLPHNDKSKGLQLNVFDNMPFSFKKMEIINKIYDFNGFPSIYSQTVRNHNKWFGLELELKDDMLNPNNINIRGFTGSFRKINKQQIKKYNDFRSKTFEYPSLSYINEGISKEDRDLIIDFVDLAKSRNIKVLLISSPYINSLYSKRYSRFNSAIALLSDSLNIDYLDFNKKFNDLDLTFDDFRDRSHVNVNGSNKVTKYLANYLSSQNYFKMVDSIPKESKGKNNVLNNTAKGERNINNIEINETLFSDLHVKELSINKAKNKIQFILHVDKGLMYNETLNKYRLGFQGLVYENDKELLSGKFKNKDRETYAINPKIEIIDNKNIISFEIPMSKIHSYKVIRFYSYGDKNNTQLEKKDFSLQNISLK